MITRMLIAMSLVMAGCSIPVEATSTEAPEAPSRGVNAPSDPISGECLVYGAQQADSYFSCDPADRDAVYADGSTGWSSLASEYSEACMAGLVEPIRELCK